MNIMISLIVIAPQVGQRAEAESEKGDQLILLHAYISVFDFLLHLQGAAGWSVQGPRQPSQDAEKPKDGGPGCDAHHLAEDHLQLAGLLSN